MIDIQAELMPISAVSQEDVRNFIDWIYPIRSKVNFDPDTLSYPRSCMTRAVNARNDETLMLLPLQPVLMFESLVKRPGLTDRQAAMSLWRIGSKVEEAARDSGHGEAYFITNDQAEADSTEKHGWTKVMHDPDKGLFLMKRKFEGTHVHND